MAAPVSIIIVLVAFREYFRIAGQESRAIIIARAIDGIVNTGVEKADG